MTHMNHSRLFRNKAELIRATVHKTDVVLDIGFLGQGIQSDSDHWPHAIMSTIAGEVFGLDLEIDRKAFPDTTRYHEESAENFLFPGQKFDVLFAGDVIEHLTNPGLFLSTCRRHMAPESRLVITTPNCFNLFNLTEKLSKDEPTVNSDHTTYFNHKTLRTLLRKCGFEIQEISYVYSLEYSHAESWKKKILNGLYAILARFTPKYLETLVVIATPATKKA